MSNLYVNGIGPGHDKIDFENHTTKFYDTSDDNTLDWNKIDDDIVEELIKKYNIKSLDDYDSLFDDYELNDKYSPDALKIVERASGPNRIRQRIIKKFGDPMERIVLSDNPTGIANPADYFKDYSEDNEE